MAKHRLEVCRAVETARLTKEQGKVEVELDKQEKSGYVDKAPAHLVDRDKAKLAELNDKLEKVRAQLVKLA
ncbi:hypothetical protein [Chromobacterium vaccinii]|uniref:Valyl-tRNA synthetase tRNA-binding arm domain-containing protein n=1 Tax=Chromobacterium vaccinii TaxID=1108595 RepID=A0A1D9LDA4_9NEIS|nr:hypothetical protein [Chromobacterium vaccinii]AOZ49220.1 hypothetical protein BKX93_03870 [Chromobacterium vaccinii]